MGRLSEEQKGYIKAFNQMIELYGMLKNSNQKNWLSEPLIAKIAEIFYLTIPNFSPAYYFQKGNLFRYRTELEIIRIKKSNLEVFIEFMDALRADVESWDAFDVRRSDEPMEARECFHIQELITENHNLLRPRYIAPQQSIVGRSKKNSETLIWEYLPPLPKNAGAKQEAIYHEKLFGTLNRPPRKKETFVLWTKRNSKLGDLYTLEPGERISCPGYSRPDLSFIKVVKFLLVKYQYLFESFSRIKV
jgi:hypothetical protein